MIFDSIYQQVVFTISNFKVNITKYKQEDVTHIGQCFRIVFVVNAHRSWRKIWFKMKLWVHFCLQFGEFHKRKIIVKIKVQNHLFCCVSRYIGRKRLRVIVRYNFIATSFFIDYAAVEEFMAFGKKIVFLTCTTLDLSDSFE